MYRKKTKTYFTAFHSDIIRLGRAQTSVLNDQVQLKKSGAIKSDGPLQTAPGTAITSPSLVVKLLRLHCSNTAAPHLISRPQASSTLARTKT